MHNIIIKTSNDFDSEDITDLDVMGLKYTKDYRITKMWVDCKSGKIKTMERLTWINGIKNYLGFNEVLFVATSKASALDYASKLGIKIFDQKIFDQIEKRFQVDQNNWYGSCNPEIFLGINEQLKKINIPGLEAKKISNLITSEYWNYDSFTGLKKAIAAIKQLKKVPISVLSKSEIQTFKWAMYQSIILLTNSILMISNEVFYLDKSKRESYISEKLIASDIPMKRRDEIFDSAVDLITSRLQSENPTLERINISFSPPSYVEALLNLIERIIDSPQYAFDILRTMDLMFMEFDLLDKKIDDELMKSLIPTYEDNLIGVKIITHFVTGTLEVEKDLFQILS